MIEDEKVEPRPSSDGTDAPPALRSEDLFRGKCEILIVHADEVYRLRVTRNGKLLLTK